MARSWSCARCEVTSTFGEGAQEVVSPTGWIERDGQWWCLGCRRAEVLDAVAREAAAGRPANRRRALAEFELRRDPSAPNHVIAKRVRCPTYVIGPVREALRVADDALPHG
jgi:hypothetical protein